MLDLTPGKQKPRACLVGGGGEGRGWGQFNEPCLDVFVKIWGDLEGILPIQTPHFYFPQTKEFGGEGVHLY